jgi:hypothetical protein
MDMKFEAWVGSLILLFSISFMAVTRSIQYDLDVAEA